MSERPDKKIVSAETQAALDYIGMMRQECAQLGNNDSEFDLLDQLRVAVENGEMDPATAKEKATAIRYAKSDYR